MSWGVWCQPNDGSQNGGWLCEGGDEDDHITYGLEENAKSSCWGSPDWTYQARPYTESK